MKCIVVFSLSNILSYWMLSYMKYIFFFPFLVDLLDVSWSKNYFILSSSMDKTVRLWHISRRECLCCFQHIDFVTAIAFHPRDDRYFLSGSLDGKLRLWNIPDKKVALWNEVDGQTKLITAANFCQNGKFAVVGSYDGRCIFYNTDQLKYHTQIHVRSTRGRNKTGRKISGIEPMPGEDKILVTSNDSRVRLYDLRDLNLSCKYKGYLNISSQIKASFSHDGKFIIAGSENQCIYIWKTNHDYSKLSSVSVCFCYFVFYTVVCSYGPDNTRNPRHKWQLILGRYKILEETLKLASQKNYLNRALKKKIWNHKSN